MSCPYCTLDHPENRILFRNDLAIYIEDRRFQGALKHSGVIIPVQHRETPFEMTGEELDGTFRLLVEVREWMEREFSPDGYNIGWNCGAVGGQTTMHAHMHVIPRFRQEPLAGSGIRTLLKSDANRW